MQSLMHHTCLINSGGFYKFDYWSVHVRLLFSSLWSNTWQESIQRRKNHAGYSSSGPFHQVRKANGRSRRELVILHLHPRRKELTGMGSGYKPSRHTIIVYLLSKTLSLKVSTIFWSSMPSIQGREPTGDISHSNLNRIHTKINTQVEIDSYNSEAIL